MAFSMEQPAFENWREKPGIFQELAGETQGSNREL
jgi:hypothetical protein